MAGLYGFVHVDMSALRYTYAGLKQMEKRMLERGISVVSGIASDARKAAYQRFFHRTSGELRYNSPSRPFYSPWRTDANGNRVPRHREPLAHKGRTGYVDAMGRRLVNFSLESKRPTRKTAYVSSIPMNLWERPAQFATYTRPGKYIMTQRLVPYVENLVPKHVAKAEEEYAQMGQQILEEHSHGN